MLTPFPLADGTERRLIPETDAPPEDMVLIQAPWVGAARDCDGGGCDSLIIDLVSKSPLLAPPSDGDLRTFMLYEAYSGQSRLAFFDEMERIYHFWTPDFFFRSLLGFKAQNHGLQINPPLSKCKTFQHPLPAFLKYFFSECMEFQNRINSWMSSLKSAEALLAWCWTGTQKKSKHVA